MRVTKATAIKRLEYAGYKNIAGALANWRNKNGQNWGWDGWFRGEYPEQVSVVWPE